IAPFQGTQPAQSYPEIILYSADLTALLALLEKQAKPQLVDWFVNKIRSLHLAGAEFAVIASNTPHMVFEEIQARSPIPLLSIVEATLKKVLSLGLKRPGLLGTGFTMKSDYYQKVFRRQGLEIAVPDAVDQQLIHQRLFTEIELGIIKESTRQELLEVIRRMKEKSAIDSVILGCTELPLILTRDGLGLPFLNTAAIHVESILRYSLGSDSFGEGAI
ncbi:MAG: amino acid racemase, partial [Lentisphaerota bacterium]